MRFIVLICVAFLPFHNAAAQPQKRSSGPVLNEHVDVHWVGEDDRYAWYEAERKDGKSELVVIDMNTGKRLEKNEFPDGVPIVDLDPKSADTALPSLAQIEHSRDGGDDTEIRFVNQSDKEVELVWVDSQGGMRSYGKIAAGESRRQHTFTNHVWLLRDRVHKPLAATKNVTQASGRFILTSETKSPVPKEEPKRRKRGGESVHQISFRDHNVWLKRQHDNEPLAITTDGTENNGYDGRVWWSPDNSHFAIFKTEQKKQREVAMVASSPSDQLQPKLKVIDYAKPGDELDHPRLCVFSVDGTKRFVVDDRIATNPFNVRDVSWRKDSGAVRFVYNQRGHQRLKLIELDVATGKSRAIIDEQSKTFIDYAGKFHLHFLDNTNELIWMSERDGWNHLYLIDQTTGEVKKQITVGPWVVRSVVSIHEDDRTMLITAGGFVSGEDPYHQHLLRVSLDGGSPIKLTDGDGDHDWKFSPNNRYFTDRCSRVDQPPLTIIRSLESGELIAIGEQADAQNLIESGWSLPKRFVAKGRDGETDIYGVIILPPEFDESKQYPVLEYIYAGPHSAHVPKSFQRLASLQRAAKGIDEKRFIIVQIDGMGTSHRSKAFHDVCWKNLGDAGFPDRIAWMKAAAESMPQMDLERIGIWGGSAGGQNAMRALVAHGDFYKAAFADCGCHDNRMDKIWWNELWMGWPIDAHYDEQSNVTQAHRVTGKLMLSVGELDTNVDPASTMQVVDALIKANKDFELLFFPGAGHGIGSGEYGTRRRIDFFSRAFYSN